MLDLLKLIYSVLPKVYTLALYVSIGILVGWLLEITGMVQRIGRIAAPLMRRTQLPTICITSFATAFASPKAANGMLSAAEAHGEISRRSAIIGGMANSFPSGLMHLRMAGPILITTLGAAGLAYVSFAIFNSTVVLVVAIVLARFWHDTQPDPPPQENANPDDKRAAEEKTKKPKLTGSALLWSRWRQLVPRVIMIAIPVYTLLAWLKQAGAFKAISRQMPPALEAALPPASLAVIVMQMSSTMRAAPLAREFLDSGELTAATVFFALVTGYLLSLPVRVLRRNLPGAISLYRGRIGIWITLLSQGTRFVVALLLVIGWFLFQLNSTPVA